MDPQQEQPQMPQPVVTEPTNGGKRNPLILLLVVAIIFFCTLLVIRFLTNRTQPESTFTQNVAQNVSPTPTPIVLSGSLMLKSTDGLIRHALAAGPINLQIVADSQGADVVGYDFLLSYDPKMVSGASGVSVRSLLPNFITFQHTNLGPTGTFELTVTGVRKLNNSQKNVWQQIPVLGVSISLKTTGPLTIGLLPRYQKETTKMVDTHSQIHYPQINTITIDVY